MTWLAPLSVLLVFCWLFFTAGPCFNDEIRDFVRARIPLGSPAILEMASSKDAVTVANLYGFTCHHWPTAWDYAIKYALLALILVCIGYLSARKFQEDGRMRAALIAQASLLLPLAIALGNSSRSLLSELHYSSYSRVLIPILVELALILLASMIAWLSAALTQRWRTRD